MLKPYKSKSLKSAERMVRNLRRQISQRDALLNVFDRDRRLMAKLAAEAPQFSNPITVMEAKKLRDEILNLE
jgi:hypothetical protein